MTSVQERKHQIDEQVLSLQVWIEAATNSQWIELTHRNVGWLSATEQLEAINLLKDGWDGLGALSASRQTLIEATELLRVLETSDVVAPMVGLDSDGFIVLTWDENDLCGSLSIFGDGTFSCYIENRDGSFSDGELLIATLLETGLIQARAT